MISEVKMKAPYHKSFKNVLLHDPHSFDRLQIS